MKPTRALTLLATALVAGVAAYLWSTYSVTHGREIPVSGFNVLFSLPSVSVVLVILALPIYRYRRELNKRLENKNATSGRPNSQTAQQLIPVGGQKRVKRVDPFYAVRVLLLAKATAIAGSLFAGWHLGVVLIQFSSPVISSGVWLNLGTMLGALISVGIALWVESICKIPDDPDEKAKGNVQLGTATDAALGRITDNRSRSGDHL